jgi:saccharopine dehydrogenase (NAD+, L-lysine-forming)
MGRISVRDLFETAPEGTRIVVADYAEAAAKKLARTFKSPRVVGVGLDVTDARATAKVFAGCFAVINAVQYQLNLPVMKACLAAGAHYVDLGGLFHVTVSSSPGTTSSARRACSRSRDARRQRTNLLARDAADRMDEVTGSRAGRRRGLSGGARRRRAGVVLLDQTILEEASR